MEQPAVVSVVPVGEYRRVLRRETAKRATNSLSFSKAVLSVVSLVVVGFFAMLSHIEFVDTPTVVIIQNGTQQLRMIVQPKKYFHTQDQYDRQQQHPSSNGMAHMTHRSPMPHQHEAFQEPYVGAGGGMCQGANSRAAPSPEWSAVPTAPSSASSASPSNSSPGHCGSRSPSPVTCQASPPAQGTCHAAAPTQGSYHAAPPAHGSCHASPPAPPQQEQRMFGLSSSSAPLAINIRHQPSTISLAGMPLR